MPILTNITMRMALALMLVFAAHVAFAGENDDGGARRTFAHFNVNLPPGWDGDEQKGFISDNPDEYLLTLGKKDTEGDRFVAQVSIFLLPNKPGVNGEEAASRLAAEQGNSTKPVQEGPFWVFEGEPRSRTISGRGVTRVATNPQWMLIIIAQDPAGEDAAEIIRSLAPTSEIGRQLLGQ